MFTSFVSPTKKKPASKKEKKRKKEKKKEKRKKPTPCPLNPLYGDKIMTFNTCQPLPYFRL